MPFRPRPQRDRAAPSFAPRSRALVAVANTHYRRFANAGDQQGAGLVAMLHTWETGRDKAPEWDIPLARKPQTTTMIGRRDTSDVDATMRPTDANDRCYIHLVDFSRDRGWDPAASLEAAPFRIAVVGMNAIALAAEK